MSAAAAPSATATAAAAGGGDSVGGIDGRKSLQSVERAGESASRCSQQQERHKRARRCRGGRHGAVCFRGLLNPSVRDLEKIGCSRASPKCRECGVPWAPLVGAGPGGFSAGTEQAGREEGG